MHIHFLWKASIDWDTICCRKDASDLFKGAYADRAMRGAQTKEVTMVVCLQWRSQRKLRRGIIQSCETAKLTTRHLSEAYPAV